MKKGDFQSAADNFNFVEGFLEANPPFIGREAWLAGESYGGVYIPMLSTQIINHPDSNIYKQFAGLFFFFYEFKAFWILIISLFFVVLISY